MSASKPIAVVSGGAGFIGSHMVDLLVAEGFRVHVIDNLAGGRLQNLDQHRNNPDLQFENQDLRSTQPNQLLFRGARGLAEELPTTERAPIQPQYPYALSKYQGEQAALHWGQVYRLPVNSIRIFNAYGPRSKTTGAYGAVFGVFLAQKLAGKPFTVVGDGTQTRDFLYVTDVARGFYAAATTLQTNEIYNLGAGKPQPVSRLVELLSGPTVRIPKRPGEPDCTWADISKIQRELSWKPKVSFEDGVKNMLDHIEYWREAPVWDIPAIEKATKTWFEFLDQKGNKASS